MEQIIPGLWTGTGWAETACPPMLRIDGVATMRGSVSVTIHGCTVPALQSLVPGTPRKHTI